MRAKELAEMHWRYIAELLHQHEERDSIIEKIEFHYKSALIHGYGHGAEDKEKELMDGGRT